MQQEVYGEVVQGEIVGVVQPAPVIATATPVTTQPGFSAEVELGAYKGISPAPRPPQVVLERSQTRLTWEQAFTYA